MISAAPILTDASEASFKVPVRVPEGAAPSSTSTPDKSLFRSMTNAVSHVKASSVSVPLYHSAL